MINSSKYRRTLKVSVLLLTAGLVCLQLHDFVHVIEHHWINDTQSQSEIPLNNELDCPVCVMNICSADIDNKTGHSYLPSAEQSLSESEKTTVIVLPPVYFQLRAPPLTA